MRDGEPATASRRKSGLTLVVAGTAIAGLLAWLSWIVTRSDEPGRGRH